MERVEKLPLILLGAEIVTLPAGDAVMDAVIDDTPVAPLAPEVVRLRVIESPLKVESPVRVAVSEPAAWAGVGRASVKISALMIKSFFIRF